MFDDYKTDIDNQLLNCFKNKTLVSHRELMESAKKWCKRTVEYHIKKLTNMKKIVKYSKKIGKNTYYYLPEKIKEAETEANNLLSYHEEKKWKDKWNKKKNDFNKKNFNLYQIRKMVKKGFSALEKIYYSGIEYLPHISALLKESDENVEKARNLIFLYERDKEKIENILAENGWLDTFRVMYNYFLKFSK